jgi:hypothetical protein
MAQCQVPCELDSGCRDTLEQPMSKVAKWYKTKKLAENEKNPGSMGSKRHASAFIICSEGFLEVDIVMEQKTDQHINI